MIFFSIELKTPYEEINLSPFLEQGNNPFKRPAAEQKNIASSGLEFISYDNDFTKTGETPVVTVAGLKAAKIVDRGQDDETLFTQEAQIFMSFKYYVSFKFCR